MKRGRCLLLAVFFCTIMMGCSNLQRNEDVLFQTSTIDALLAGVYDGDTTFKALKDHGDFGLGTFNALDGEMIALDGVFYQIKIDGVAHPVENAMKTPFSVVTFFDADQTVEVTETVDYEGLSRHLDHAIPTKNVFFGVRIDGTFKYVKTRSVPRQHVPYPPLVEVVKDQAIFEFHDVEGTIVGFRTPGYVKGINVPGYHLHFITADKKAGGHLLACEVGSITVKLDYTSKLYVVLPESGQFGEANLTKGRHKELEKVEK